MSKVGLDKALLIYTCRFTSVVCQKITCFDPHVHSRMVEIFETPKNTDRVMCTHTGKGFFAGDISQTVHGNIDEQLWNQTI